MHGKLSRSANAKLHTTVGSRNGWMPYCGQLACGSGRSSSRFWRTVGKQCRSGCTMSCRTPFFVRHEGRRGRVQRHASTHPIDPLTMQPVSQWYNVAYSNLAEEAGGKPFPVEPHDRHVHSGAFRKSSFRTAEEDSFSLGQECVRK